MLRRRARRLPSLLRTFMVGMLMLGVLAKPILSLICETHELTHLMASSDHVDSAAEQRSDADHARGDHQLVHAGDTTPAYIEPLVTLTVPAIPYADAAPAPANDVAPPSRHVDSPFRPPIA